MVREKWSPQSRYEMDLPERVGQSVLLQSSQPNLSSKEEVSSQPKRLQNQSDKLWVLLTSVTCGALLGLVGTTWQRRLLEVAV